MNLFFCVIILIMNLSEQNSGHLKIKLIKNKINKKNKLIVLKNKN